MPVSTAQRHKLTGVCPPARGAVVAELLRARVAPVWLVVAEDLKAAGHLADDLAFFHRAAGDKRSQHVLVFPESMPDSRDMREAFAASSDRLTVLSRLRATRKRAVQGQADTNEGAAGNVRWAQTLVVVTTPSALLQPVPALEEFATRE